MSYHVACYEKESGKTTTRIAKSSKNNPATGKPYICQYCKQDILIGQDFTWIPNTVRKNQGRPYQPNPAPAVTVAPGVTSEAIAEREPRSVQHPTPSQGEPTPMQQTTETVVPEAEVSTAFGFSFNPKKLADDLIPHLEGKFSPKQTGPQQMVSVIKVELTNNGETIETKELGMQHAQFETLVKMIQAGLNVWIAGPAGSGKTTACINAAKALDLEFFYTGAINDEHKLMGYMNAHGAYVETPFYKAYKFGGLFLWDEVDACDSNAILAFQAALENGHCAFPCGMVEKHPNFHCVAAANTWGLGATVDYVGRNRLDAAFIDRFAMLPWAYDEALELATAPVPEFTKFVQSLRAKVKEKGIKVLVTPRASYQGGKLLKSGLGMATVLRASVQKAMTDDQWQAIKPNTIPSIQAV